MVHERYEVIVSHKPERFLRRWNVIVERVLRVGSHVERIPVVGSPLPCRFTKSGAVFAGALAADEDRRRRRDLANAEVVRLP